MNKLLCTAVAAVGSLMAGQSLAADMAPAAPAPYKAPVVAPVPVFSWTGFYVGGNIGYGFARATADVTFLGATTRIDSENLSGAVGGAQAGFNWQTGPLVLGVEADLQWSGQKAVTTLGAITQTDRINTFGTVRARAGVAVDRVLLYGTGGWAYGTWRTDLVVPGVGNGNYSNSRSAWVAGGGAELAFTDHLTARLEYLYLDTGRINDTTTIPTVTFSNRLKDNVVRVGLNYLFNSGPVTARY